MKILLSQVNTKIYPHKINKRILTNIVSDLFSKLNQCYNHELSHILHKDKREKRLCEIVHTHCFNGTATTKKAIKNTLKKHLSDPQYTKFGLQLIYAILEIGVDITSDNSMLLIEESKFMNIDPKLEAIANKVMDKMDLSSNEKYGNIILVIMIVGIILSLVRVIQECNKSKLNIFSVRDKAKFMKDEMNSMCISRTFFNKWRLKKIIKEKLNSEDYKLYGTKLREAILDTGIDLTEEESYALMEAVNNA
jgi:hypothetical protein